MAADAVQVRAGAHKTHDRLVMDWESRVDYQISGQAPNYQITFGTGAELTLPAIANLKRFATLEISSREPLILQVRLQDGNSLTVSRVGSRIVMDAAPDKRKKDTPPALEKTAEKAPEKPNEKTAAKPTEKPEVASIKKQIDEAVKVLPWSEDQDAGAPSPLEAKAAKEAADAAAKAAEQAKAAAAPPAAAPVGNVGPGGRPLTLAEMAARDAEQKAAREKTDKEKAAKDPTAATDPNAATAEDGGEQEAFSALPATLPNPSAVVQIKLKVPENTKFAAYMRGKKFWIVLDQLNLAMPTDEADAESSMFGPVTRYQVGGGTGTAYRIQLADGQYPALSKSDGGELIFTVYNQMPLIMPVGLPVGVEVVPEMGPRLRVKAPGFAVPLRVSDPDVGDEIFAVPAAATTGAVSVSASWPQVAFLPALNGVAVSPRVDNILVDVDKAGLSIARPPKGLMLSEAQGLERQRNASTGEQIFALDRWRIGSFKNYHRLKAQMESALTDIRGPQRLGRIMQLAQFMFAQGYAREAMGWLRIAAQEFPNADQVPEYILLRGAVRVASMDPVSGDRDLSIAGYAFEPEVALWRGWAAIQKEDLQRARYFFGLASALLHEYPDPYFKPIALAAAETALLTGDAVAGGALISRLKDRKDLEKYERAHLNYLRGLEASLNGRSEEALQFWEKAVKSRDAMAAAKSELLLVQEGLKSKKIEPKDAIKRLERLRYSWRGDRTELATLIALADLYSAEGKPRYAFENWQTIIRYFSNEPQAESARQKISQNFVSLFSPEQQSAMEPIESLALFHDFIGYAPTEQVREQITRQLVDRLASVEMVKEAAELLAGIVRPMAESATPNAAPAASDVLRLAGLYLLDSQAPAAREALGFLARTQMTPPEEAEHRLLSARADFVESKYDEALQNLAPLSDINAQRVRADIFWRTQKWSEAAKAMTPLLGNIAPDDKLSPEQAKTILYQAVAFSLAGEGENLAALRDQYSAKMDVTTQAASFRLITRPPKGSEVQSIKAIQSQLGEVDSFNQFLQSYRGGEAAVKKP